MTHPTGTPVDSDHFRTPDGSPRHWAEHCGFYARPAHSCWRPAFHTGDHQIIEKGEWGETVPQKDGDEESVFLPTSS